MSLPVICRGIYTIFKEIYVDIVGLMVYLWFRRLVLQQLVYLNMINVTHVTTSKHCIINKVNEDGLSSYSLRQWGGSCSNKKYSQT